MEGAPFLASFARSGAFPSSQKNNFFTSDDRMLQELLVIVIGILHAIMRAATLLARQSRTRDQQSGQLQVRGLVRPSSFGMSQPRSHFFQRLDRFLHPHTRTYDSYFILQNKLNLPDQIFYARVHGAI